MAHQIDVCQLQAVIFSTNISILLSLAKNINSKVFSKQFKQLLCLFICQPSTNLINFIDPRGDHLLQLADTRYLQVVLPHVLHLVQDGVR